MASLRPETDKLGKPNGRWRLQFTDGHGIRRTLRTGKASETAANKIKGMVEAILDEQAGVADFSGDVAKWIRRIGDALAKRMAKVGLIEPRTPQVKEAPPAEKKTPLGLFLDSIIELKEGTRKARTALSAKNDAVSIVSFFGADKAVEDVDADDAARFLAHLNQKGYAKATVGRRIRRCKEFWNVAVRKRLIQLADHPFADTKAPSQKNEARKATIDTEMTRRLMAKCPNAQWRCIVALSRFGGFRCPSETMLLRWRDVDWEAGEMLVTSPKTACHDGGENRRVPIFGPLLPFLREAFEEAEEGAEFVITIPGARDVEPNLRHPMLQIIKAAGLKPWPRLFHNLRASRQTELLHQHPAHVVSRWLGNSVLIADQHYATMTASDHAKALAENECASISDVRGVSPHPSTSDTEGETAVECRTQCATVGVGDTWPARQQVTVGIVIRRLAGPNGLARAL